MSFKKDKILFICLAGSLAVPTAAFAGADSGFYVGGSVGDASVKIDDSDFDESDAAYKIFGGYNIGFIPLVDFAVEGSYVDFGSAGSNVGNVDITGWDAFGLAGLSFGPFGIFAKAGAIAWDADTSIGGGDSGTDPAYGLGARFAIGSFAIRAEYEVFDLDGADLEMVSVGGSYTF